MSRHVPRKERWSQVHPSEYRSAFGVVKYRAGAWEGTVAYELRPEPTDALPEPLFEPLTAPAGRHKRPRNAMMAVEDKARELLRRHGANIRIAFED